MSRKLLHAGLFVERKNPSALNGQDLESDTPVLCCSCLGDLAQGTELPEDLSLLISQMEIMSTITVLRQLNQHICCIAST